MGFFTDYLYEKLPFSDITLEEIEKCAKFHFTQHEIRIENDKLYIESDKVMASKYNTNFEAHGEITIDKDTLCFKSTVNASTIVVYGVIIIGLSIMMVSEFFGELSSMGSGSVFLTLFVIALFSALFLVGIRIQLHRNSRFLAKTITAAVKTFKMK